jgi:hypothetical protein
MLVESSQAQVNSNGGLFYPGHAYGLSEKIRIARIFNKLSAQQIKPVGTRQLAKAGGCCKSFANKLIKELKETTTINDPKDKKQRRDRGIYMI